MSDFTIGLIGMGVMLVLMFLRMPLSFSFIVAGIGGIVLILGPELGLNYMKTLPYTTVASYTFAVMPMFMLMSDFATDGKLTASAYNAARRWLGRLPGGLAITTSVASAIFGAICGSQQATAIVMTQMSYPEMKRYGYKPELALGAIAAAAPLAILIPPSTPMIIYGILSGASIGKLFLAGWIPGLLLLACLIAAILIQVKRRPEWAPAPEKKFTLKEKCMALLDCLPILILVFLVMFCIWGGASTVNEAAGIGAIGALIIVLVQRKLNFKECIACMKNCAVMSSSMFFLFVGVQIFNVFMSLSGVPAALATWVSSLPLSPYAVVWVIVGIYLILGCFIDTPPIMMLTIPLFAPVMTALGFDLIWFGVVSTVCIAMGGITPPVGICLFLTSAKSGEGLHVVMKGIWPFVIATFVALVILIYVPTLSLWLPGLAG